VPYVPTNLYVIEEQGGGAWDRRPGHYTPFEIEMWNDRIRDVKNGIRDFKEAKTGQKGDSWHFFLNDEKVVKIGGLFINDIKEFKLLNIANIGTDNLKRAGYISRWIAKIRPIEFDRKFAKKSPMQLDNPQTAFLNEEFAAYVFFLYLDGFNSDWFQTSIAASIIAQLRYIFIKRNPERELMVALAYTTQVALCAGAL
jgi:hypothetical protein